MEENYFTYIYTVPNHINEIILKDYLIRYHGYSSRLIRKIKREGYVRLNGDKVSMISNVNGNDQLVVKLAKEKIDAQPEEIPLDIIYEDHDILIVNKQWGIVTHPTLSHPSGNLANAIAWHWDQNSIEAKIRFVNRLDRDTSGAVIIAKNKYAHHYIQNEMKEDRVAKVYWAIVEGIPLSEKGTIDLPIGRRNEDSIMREIIQEGKHAVTHYELLEKYRDNALLKINIETGRTHQIRVHLKGIGHPIVGDSLYNQKKSSFINRQALHAKEIAFIHPRRHKLVNYDAHVPQDIMKLMNELRNTYTRW